MRRVATSCGLSGDPVYGELNHHPAFRQRRPTGLLESSLSFLGLGVQPPAASWGNMLSGARGYLRTVPGLAVLPGLVIFVAVLCYNWFGDGLRDAIDPTR